MRFKPEWEFYKRIIKRFAWNTPYHPVRDYLDSADVGQVPRIDQWIEHVRRGGGPGPEDGISAQTTYSSGECNHADRRRPAHPASWLQV